MKPEERLEGENVAPSQVFICGLPSPQVKNIDESLLKSMELIFVWPVLFNQIVA